MRCTRCDRPAVPQAVGRTPDGLVVFGWCVSCLEETGCLDVRVARHPTPRRPLARSSRPAPPALLAAGLLPRPPRRGPLVVALTSLALGVSVVARWVEVRRFRPLSPCERG